MNEIANIAEKVGADVEMVRQGIGSDPRIGWHFIYPGAGYGGSCFPKDVQALERTAHQHGYRAELLRSEEHTSELQVTVKSRMPSTEIYTLSLHDALPIYERDRQHRRKGGRGCRDGAPGHRLGSAHRLAFHLSGRRLRWLVLPEGRTGAGAYRAPARVSRRAAEIGRAHV